MALPPRADAPTWKLARGICLTQVHAILGSGVDTHVDLLIGGLALRLSSRDFSLLTAACRRYQGFHEAQRNPFSIRVDREPAETNGLHTFACDFEGARVVADLSGAHFSGVRHEYALDSLLRMF